MLKRRHNRLVYSESSFEDERPCKTVKKTLDFNLEIVVPHRQKALVIETFDTELVYADNITVSQLQDYEIMVKNKYVGLNHVDWKSKRYKFNIYSFPWVNGRESSGIVVKRGTGVDAKKFPLGTEVFLASTSYRDLKTSTFQEYTIFDSRLVWRVPQVKLDNGVLARKFDLDFAAGIGVGLVTAGAALSHIINIGQEDDKKQRNIAIWGGTSSVGIYVIQLARASAKFENILVIAASKHGPYLKSLGASHVIDRHKSEDEITQELLSICPEGINSGIDLVSKKTASILYNVLEKESCKEKKLVCIVETPEIATKNIGVDSKSKLIIEKVSIKKFHEDTAYGMAFVDYTSKLFEEGRLKPVQSLKIFKTLGTFGESIKNGLEELERNRPSAEKYVASL